MKLVCAFGLFAIFAFVMYGWGWAARKLLRTPSLEWPTSWPATAATGMAALVFVGGVLNLTRLAYPSALAVVAIAGVAFGALALKHRGLRGDPTSWAVFGFAIAVLCFVVLTQVPPRAYNFHDDYQKYFVHPVRMVETGTVFGSPLNDIGFDTIGGQAFLDGFVVAFLPIRYINGVGVFALFLCMMLASQFTRGRRELIPLTLVCAASVVFINPQYVNISALYTGSLLMMAVFDDEEASPAITGLLYAALLALKSTFALFVVLHLAAVLLTGKVKGAMRASLACALFFAPWFLLHTPHYLAMVHPTAAAAENGVRSQETFNLFSTGALDYGAAPMNYTGLMLAVGLSGLMIVWSRRKVGITAAACFAMVVGYLVMIYVSGPRNAGYAQAVRYFAPFAIGAAPAAFGSAGLAFFDSARIGVAGPRLRWLRLGIPLLVASIPVFAFGPSLGDRIREARDSGSVLAFSWLAPAPEYLEYNQEVLYGDMRQRVATAQAVVPVGEVAVVWINAPFYLDFKRNRIADVEPGAGLIAPWSGLSKVKPEPHYFIYEYGGYATVDPDEYREEMAEGPDMMRRVGAARLNMTETLSAMMRRGEKLYDDGAIAVFRE